MLDVVGELVGVHAQVMSSAELTLWARVADLEPDAVRRALWEERSLVKLWAMRGTLHLARASEHALWRDALSTYRHWRRPSWARAFGVDDAESLINRVGAALEDRQLTREELAAEVGSEALADNWGAVLKPPSFLGLLCFAPSDGQRVRFTSPRTWLATEGESAPDPVAELIRRYIESHGPATRGDVARWWAGTTPAQTERILDRVAERVDLEGETAWATSDQLEAIEPVRSVRLLPGFDQYVVAASLHCDRLLPDPALVKRIYRPQGWLTPVLCVDGRIDGVWRFERKGRRVAVSIEPFVKTTKRVREEAEREAQSLAAFLGGQLELAWTA
ncbi:MAG: hypothetical protein QOG63_1632 [Thermoleophilaceae bacterium]|nr:hypothetical protein [Thermoleophilaceae bacterium]